jgi:molecular chaperone DnaK (HSP70)
VGLPTGNLNIYSAPTAAILAYAAEDEKLGKPAERKLVLVFDLGWRDVRFHVGRSQRDGASESWPPQETHTWEGRTSFCRLVEWCVKKYFERHQINLKVSGSRNVLAKLYSEFERAKRILSPAAQARANILNAVRDEFSVTMQLLLVVTVDGFSEACKDEFKRCLDLVDEALSSLQVKAPQVDEVLLVGASSRIPMIQRILGGRFGPEKLRKDINPFEVVTYGAAIHAATCFDVLSMQLRVPAEQMSGMYDSIISTRCPHTDASSYR